MDGALHELVLAEVSQAEALAGLEDDTGAAHELRHHHALGAVDDEGALLRHHGEVTHEVHLLFDLTGVAVEEAGPDEDRRLVRHVALLALLDGVLGRGEHVGVGVVRVELELELQGFAEVLDRRDVAEGLAQTLAEEPLEALSLDGDEIGELERLREIGERVAIA